MISRRKFIQNTGAGVFLTAIPNTTNAINNIKKYDIEYYYTEYFEKLNLYGTSNESYTYANYLKSKSPSYDVTFLNIYVDTSIKNIKIFIEDLASKS